MINTTFIENSSGNWFITILQGINTASGGVFGLFLQIAVFVIPFFASLRWGVRAATGTSAFVGALSGLLLRLMGIINDTTFYASIVIVVGMVLVLFFSNE